MTVRSGSRSAGGSEAAIARDVSDEQPGQDRKRHEGPADLQARVPVDLRRLACPLPARNRTTQSTTSPTTTRRDGPADDQRAREQSDDRRGLRRVRIERRSAGQTRDDQVMHVGETLAWRAVVPSRRATKDDPHLAPDTWCATSHRHRARRIFPGFYPPRSRRKPFQTDAGKERP